MAVLPSKHVPMVSVPANGTCKLQPRREISALMVGWGGSRQGMVAAISYPGLTSNPAGRSGLDADTAVHVVASLHVPGLHRVIEVLNTRAPPELQATVRLLRLARHKLCTALQDSPNLRSRCAHAHRETEASEAEEPRSCPSCHKPGTS